MVQKVTHNELEDLLLYGNGTGVAQLDEKYGRDGWTVEPAVFGSVFADCAYQASAERKADLNSIKNSVGGELGFENITDGKTLPTVEETERILGVMDGAVTDKALFVEIARRAAVFAEEREIARLRSHRIGKTGFLELDDFEYEELGVESEIPEAHDIKEDKPEIEDENPQQELSEEEIVARKKAEAIERLRSAHQTAKKKIVRKKAKEKENETKREKKKKAKKNERARERRAEKREAAELERLEESLESGEITYDEYLKLAFKKAGINPEDDKRITELGVAANIYPSAIRAYFEGGAIPSEENVRNLHAALPEEINIDVETAVTSAQRSLEEVKDEKEHLLLSALGKVTLDTKIGGRPEDQPEPLLQTLFVFRKSPFKLREAAEACPHIGESRLSHMKNGQAEKMREKHAEERTIKKRIPPYKQESLDELMDYLGVSGEARILFCDVAYQRKPARTIAELIDYAAEEKLKFGAEGGFLDLLMDELRTDQYGLADALCSEQPKISAWYNEKWDLNESSKIGGWVDQVTEKHSLKKPQIRNLWRVVRGSKAHGTVEDIVNNAEKILSPEYTGKERKEEIPNILLNQLIEESGLPYDRIAQSIGISTSLLSDWRKDKNLVLDPFNAQRVAGTFAPDNRALIRRTQNALQGNLEQVTMVQMLDEALENIGEELKSDPDAAKKRFAEIVREDISRKGKTREEYGASINHNSGVSKGCVNKWCAGGTSISEKPLAEALAKHIGYNAQKAVDFVRLAQGRPRFYDTSVLEEFYNGTNTRAETVRKLRQNSGRTQQEFGEEIGGSLKIANTIERKGLIPPEHLDEAVKILGIPEKKRPRFKKEFVRTPENIRDEEKRKARLGAGDEGTEPGAPGGSMSGGTGKAGRKTTMGVVRSGGE